MAKKKAVAGAAPASAEDVRLSEVAKLLRLPPGVRDQTKSKGGKRVKMVSIVDLPSSGFVSEVTNTVSLATEKFAEIKKYTLQPYDVLMSIQGTVGVVGVLPEALSGTWMANISLLTIRFADRKLENAIALLAYLKSPKGRNLIKELEKGTTIKRINVKDFAKSKTPALSATVIREAKKVFDGEIKIFEKIDALLATVDELRSGYLQT